MKVYAIFDYLEGTEDGDEYFSSLAEAKRHRNSLYNRSSWPTIYRCDISERLTVKLLLKCLNRSKFCDEMVVVSPGTGDFDFDEAPVRFKEDVT